MAAGNAASNGERQKKQMIGEEYFTLEQISHALQRDLAAVKREAKTETINGKLWVSKKEAGRIVSKREPLRQKRIRRRLPKPTLIDTSSSAAHKTGELPMKTVGKKKYYSLHEAAQFLGESVQDVQVRIRKNEILHENIKGEVCVPVLPLQDFLYDRKKVSSAGTPPESSATKVKALENKLRVKETENKKLVAMLEKEKAQRNKDTNSFKVRLRNLQGDKESSIIALKSEVEKLRKERQIAASDLEEESKRREDAEKLVQNLRTRPEEGHDFISGLRGIFGRPTESERIGELEYEINALKVTLQTDTAYLESELAREREGRKQDKLDIGYERDRFEAELENLRRDSEAQAARIEQEKRLRENTQRRAQEYYSDLEQLRDSRETLNQSEAARESLEKELAREKERGRHLKADATLLAEIRNLLGTNFEQPKETTEAAPSPTPPPSRKDTKEEPDEDKAEPLVIKTFSGKTVMFRPPFELDSREVELIHLVAGEAEITAAQINSRINKRAAKDLNDLLDRLHEKGLEPIVQDNDVYRFDPNFLDDEK